MLSVVGSLYWLSTEVLPFGVHVAAFVASSLTPKIQELRFVVVMLNVPSNPVVLIFEAVAALDWSEAAPHKRRMSANRPPDPEEKPEKAVLTTMAPEDLAIYV